MFGTVFFFTVLAAVNDFFRICQEEYMIQLLLNGSDASGVAAFDDVFDLFGKYQYLLLYLSLIHILCIYAGYQKQNKQFTPDQSQKNFGG